MESWSPLIATKQWQTLLYTGLSVSTGNDVRLQNIKNILLYPNDCTKGPVVFIDKLLTRKLYFQNRKPSHQKQIFSSSKPPAMYTASTDSTGMIIPVDCVINKCQYHISRVYNFFVYFTRKDSKKYFKQSFFLTRLFHIM
jgi:hypothetical protein